MHKGRRLIIRRRRRRQHFNVRWSWSSITGRMNGSFAASYILAF